MRILFVYFIVERLFDDLNSTPILSLVKFLY
jgi:hypothetical protein